jgi:hypothetical protein
MPRLMVVGDIHGEIHEMYRLVDSWERRTGLTIDGVVQVGDLGVYSSGTDFRDYWDGLKAPKPTIAILGNHEDIVTANRWLAEPDRIQNMRLLLDGRIENFLGVNIGGIWGNYSPVSYKNADRVYDNRVTGNSHRIAMHINRYSVETLLDNPGPMDVLITHDSARITFPPYFGPMDPMVGEILGLSGREEMVQAKGCPGFDQILKQFKPRKYFYGHLHTDYKLKVGATETRCLHAIQYDKFNCFEVTEL